MKYIKKFENIDIEPEVGDYVLMRINLIDSIKKDEINNYINNTIGQIIQIHPSTEEIRIRYDNIPDNIKDWFRNHKDWIKDNGDFYSRILQINKIVAIGKTPEEVILNRDINKYNL